MTAIPEPSHTTVAAIFQRYEELEAGIPPREYLGASEIGDVCRRRLWLRFRWAAPSAWPGRMLRLFDTGHQQEQRVRDDLAGIGCHVTGAQEEVVFAGGHGKGHCDGVVLGLVEAPKTWHLLEVKSANSKRYAAVVKYGVEAEEPRHYAQMQVYMDLMKLERGCYVVVNKNDESMHLERVHHDREHAAKLLQKATEIVFSAEPPPPISTDPDAWDCKGCEFHPQCHGKELPQVHCRTCAHATPTEGGAWRCELHGDDIPLDFQRTGCDGHRYIPVLVEKVAQVIEVEGNRVKWRNLTNGQTFVQPDYSSREMAAAKDFRAVGDEMMTQFKEIFGTDTRLLNAETLTLKWQTFDDGTRHVRKEIGGKFVSFVAQTPELVKQLRELGDPEHVESSDGLTSDLLEVYGVEKSA